MILRRASFRYTDRIYEATVRTNPLSSTLYSFCGNRSRGLARIFLKRAWFNRGSNDHHTNPFWAIIITACNKCVSSLFFLKTGQTGCLRQPNLAADDRIALLYRHSRLRRMRRLIIQKLALDRCRYRLYQVLQYGCVQISAHTVFWIYRAIHVKMWDGVVLFQKDTCSPHSAIFLPVMSSPVSINLI